MSVAEQLEDSTLYIAATRPAMYAGIPLPLAGALLMMAGLVVVVFGNPFYEVVMLPIWIAAKALVARDYNAANILFLWLRTAGRGMDGSTWGGATLSPNPIKIPKRGRGMV